MFNFLYIISITFLKIKLIFFFFFYLIISQKNLKKKFFSSEKVCLLINCYNSLLFPIKKVIFANYHKYHFQFPSDFKERIPKDDNDPQIKLYYHPHTFKLNIYYKFILFLKTRNGVYKLKTASYEFNIYCVMDAGFEF